MTMAANVLRMTKVEINSISVNPFWPVQGFFNGADNLAFSQKFKMLTTLA
jgi:hypothetical protein